MSRTARALVWSAGGAGFRHFPEGGDTEGTPPAGDPSFSIQLSMRALCASSRSVNATPMPIPGCESRTTAAHINSVPPQLMWTRTLDPTGSGFSKSR